jgi:hypothetical protein
MGYGLPPAGNGPHSQQPGPNMQSGPLPPAVPFAPAPGRTSRLAVVLGAIALVLAGAALVVSLVRKPEAQSPAQQTPTPAATELAPLQQIFVGDADRALCEAIAPLMTESNNQAKTFSALASGSPEQIAALPTYRKFTEDWAGRIQSILNTHSDPPRFMTRTLQRFIDDTLLYAELPAVDDETAANTWRLSLSDYAGPRATCYNLGVNW